MSYILDALRRADAERERGGVPGLHSQAAAGTGPATAPPPQRAAWVAAGVAVLAVAALAGVGYVRQGDGERGERLPTPAPAPTPTPASTPAPAPAPVTRPPAAAPAAPNPAREARPASPPAVAVAPAAPPRTSAPVVAAPAPPAAAVPPPAPAPAPPAAPAESRIVPWEQLPDDVRRQIPPLAVGGAIYSDQPASRMLVVAGQLLHEGDSAAPGVVLEQIRPRSAVLRWRDLRYEVSY